MHQEKLQKISVVIIASNEERRIELCLKSIYSWAQEIIVVLNDCTDQTEAIAKQYGAQVFNHPWEGFSKQKNYALAKANQPWILSLDADEIVGEQLKQSIIHFISEEDISYNGACFKEKTFFMDRWIKHGLWKPSYRRVRLFRKGSARWSNHAVHEQLIVPGKIKKLKGLLYHFSFSSIDHYINKMLHYTRLAYPLKTNGNKLKAWMGLFRAIWTFCRSYIFRLGFLDGFPGLYLAWSSAFFSFLKQAQKYPFLEASNHLIPEKDNRGVA